MFEEDAAVKKILTDKYTPAIEEMKAEIVGSSPVALDGERANVQTYGPVKSVSQAPE